MRAKDLRTVWAAPDNSRLTAKQVSIRLPVHVAAKLAALCEMYPAKSRTQIIGDLLAAALAEVEEHMPSIEGRITHVDHEQGVTFYEEVGEVGVFRDLADKHYLELERELGTVDPKPLYSGTLIAKEGVETNE